MTTAKPPARYGAMVGARAGGFALAELHHHSGPDRLSSSLPFAMAHARLFWQYKAVNARNLRRKFVRGPLKLPYKKERKLKQPKGQILRRALLEIFRCEMALVGAFAGPFPIRCSTSLREWGDSRSIPVGLAAQWSASHKSPLSDLLCAIAKHKTLRSPADPHAAVHMRQRALVVGAEDFGGLDGAVLCRGMLPVNTWLSRPCS